jgi:hypothetical protein
MPTPQPSPQPLGEMERKEKSRTKAKLRKQRFDARMLNIDAANGAQRRYATVVYLNESAKDALHRNRQQRRLLDLPNVSDSVLIEQLLLKYENENVFDDMDQELQTSVTKVKGNTAKLLEKNKLLEEKIKFLKLHLFAAEATIEKLESEIEVEPPVCDWETTEYHLLNEHWSYMSRFGYRAAKRIKSRIGGTENDVITMRVVHEEFEEYIKELMFALKDQV